MKNQTLTKNEQATDEVYAQLSEGFDSANAEINTRDRIVRLFADTVDKRRNYHEVHPDGGTARGQIDDVKYEQVIVDGKVTFTVAVRDNLIGMFYDADTYAIVDLHTDTIVEGRSLGQFAEFCRDGLDASECEYHWDNGKVIVHTAHMEESCPRWGMSW